MCLAIPGKVVEIFKENSLKMGRVDYSGTSSVACLEYAPEASIGDFVIVHAGFAISVIDEAEARETLELWDEMIRKSAGLSMDEAAVPPAESEKGDR